MFLFYLLSPNGNHLIMQNKKKNEEKRQHPYKYSFNIDQDKCIKCDWCLKAKPHKDCILMLEELKTDTKNNIISIKKTERRREMNVVWINSDECTRCGICLKVCPVDAIDRIQIPKEANL